MKIHCLLGNSTRAAMSYVCFRALVVAAVLAGCCGLRTKQVGETPSSTQPGSVVTLLSNHTSALSGILTAAGGAAHSMVPMANTIFDFGFYDGHDSWTYLQGGFNVVAVEADPTLVQKAHENVHFQPFLSSGKLQIINAAIAPVDPDNRQAKWTTFYMSKCTKEWNSFYPSVGCRACTAPHTETSDACQAVHVQSMSCAMVLQSHGVPMFLKLDIEGGESGCWDALKQMPQQERPKYLSNEVGGLELIDELSQLGYTSFKVVHQKVGGQSGPWGDAAQDCRTGGAWRTFGEARWELNAIFNKANVPGDICPGMKQGVGGDSGYIWYDLHASVEPVPVSVQQTASIASFANQVPVTVPVAAAQKDTLVHPPLFVAIFSTRKTPGAQRQVVRDMWRSVDNGSGNICARHIFCKGSDGYQAALDQEQHANGDMLFLDCQEGYAEGLLTKKVIASMAAFTSSPQDACLSRRLYMKTDDDTFVAGHKFRQWISETWNVHGENIYAGVSIPSQPPNRDPNSHWYEPPAVFPEPNYPTAMYGGPGYIVGRGVVDRFFLDGAVNRVLWNEDRAVGVWVDQLQKNGMAITNVKIPGTNGFHWDQPVVSGTFEAYPYILAHHLSKETIACMVGVDNANVPSSPINHCFR